MFIRWCEYKLFLRCNICNIYGQFVFCPIISSWTKGTDCELPPSIEVLVWEWRTKKKYARVVWEWKKKKKSLHESTLLTCSLSKSITPAHPSFHKNLRMMVSVSSPSDETPHPSRPPFSTSPLCFMSVCIKEIAAVCASPGMTWKKSYWV